jgi:hypothetical protein
MAAFNNEHLIHGWGVWVGGDRWDYRLSPVENEAVILSPCTIRITIYHYLLFVMYVTDQVGKVIIERDILKL